MSIAAGKITISTSPFLHGVDTTPRIMWEVTLTLLPVVAAAYYFFGLAALLLIGATIAGCLAAEYLFLPATKRKSALRDGSATLTGLLLALCLPPGFPLWMSFVGGFVAIGMGKMIWGGLGNNVFNPALVGRAFLQAAFPTAITTWSAPDGRYLSLRGTNLALPFFQGHAVDAISSATPLATMKFDHVAAPLMQLLWGNTSGSLGETSAILFILAGLYLLFRKIINWRIVVSIVAMVVAFSGIFWLMDGSRYPSPLFMLLSGGLLLGTVYMATDLVTSPITPRGLWIYGLGIGFLVVLIRTWGGLPEGVMYAILLMNACTPLINRFTKIKPYGHS